MEGTQAIITRLTRLTDTSLIVHWFTEDYGLVKTVAKGARRPKSPFAGKLDLFYGGEINVSQSRHGELHTLREVSIHAWREGLRRTYCVTLLAAYFCQLLEAAVEPEHPAPELYDLLRRGLDHLHESSPTLKAMRHFENELARHLGILATQGDPALALRDALDPFPSSRTDLVERLSLSEDFSSQVL